MPENSVEWLQWYIELIRNEWNLFHESRYSLFDYTLQLSEQFSAEPVRWLSYPVAYSENYIHSGTELQVEESSD